MQPSLLLAVTVPPEIQTCQLTIRGSSGSDLRVDCLPSSNSSSSPHYTNILPHELDAEWSAVFPEPSPYPTMAAYVEGVDVGVVSSDVHTSLFRAASEWRGRGKGREGWREGEREGGREVCRQAELRQGESTFLITLSADPTMPVSMVTYPCGADPTPSPDAPLSMSDCTSYVNSTSLSSHVFLHGDV